MLFSSDPQHFPKENYRGLLEIKSMLRTTENRGIEGPQNQFQRGLHSYPESSITIQLNEQVNVISKCRLNGHEIPGTFTSGRFGIRGKAQQTKLSLV